MAALHSRCGHYIFVLWFLLSFFLAYSQPSQIGCLPYFDTWCGRSANLKCRPEMCCTRLAENTGRKKNRQKFAICVLSHNFVGLCLCSLGKGMYRESEKSLLNNNISTSPDSMVNVGPLMAEIGSGVWGTPANFNGFRVSASLLNRRQPNFARCWAVSWACTLYIHFFALLPPNGILPVQNSLCPKSCVFLYWQRYCTALEQWA